MGRFLDRSEWMVVSIKDPGVRSKSQIIYSSSNKKSVVLPYDYSTKERSRQLRWRDVVFKIVVPQKRTMRVCK